MADDKPKLASHIWSDEQRQRISTWLMLKWGEKPCPQCGKAELNIGPSPVMIVNLSTDGKTTQLGGGYPSVSIVCDYCGYTMLVNGIIAKIFPREDGKEVGDG